MSRLSSLFGKPGVSPKYRAHGVDLGFPVKGHHDVPPEKRTKVLLGKGQKLDVQITVHVKNFDLSKPEELAEYTDLRDKIGNRLYLQADRRVWTNPDTGDVKVYMEWYVPEYLKPPGDAPSEPAEAPVGPVGPPASPVRVSPF